MKNLTIGDTVQLTIGGPIMKIIGIIGYSIKNESKTTDQRLQILRRPRRTYLEKREIIDTTNDPSRILLATIFEDVS